MHRAIEPIMDEIDFVTSVEKMPLEEALIVLETLQEKIRTRIDGVKSDIAGEVKAKGDQQ